MPVASAPAFSWRQLYTGGRLSQYLLLLASVAAVIGLFASRALVALSPVVGLLAALAQPQLRAGLRQWGRHYSVLMLAALYIFLALSGLYTEEHDVWRHELYRKLPFLVVPLAFAVAVPLSRRQRFGVGLLYVGLGTALALTTLGSYLRRPGEWNDLINIGHYVPVLTGLFHIHFSIMLALAFFFALLMSRSALATTGLRMGLRLTAGLIFLTMHILAYRTGLLVLYAMLLLDVVLLVRRHLGRSLLLLLALLGLGAVAYGTLEPLQTRLGASRWDIDQFRNGQDINDYSLSRRLAAWQTALVIAQEHPVLGVGMADVDAAMLDQYSYYDFGLQPKNRAMTHNQYLEYLVGGGAVGLLLWLLALFGPLLQPALRQNPYVIHFLFMMSVVNLVDSLLQLQIGFNLFVFLYGFLVIATERQACWPAGYAA